MLLNMVPLAVIEEKEGEDGGGVEEKRYISSCLSTLCLSVYMSVAVCLCL